jgi:hypothetical protein
MCKEGKAGNKKRQRRGFNPFGSKSASTDAPNERTTLTGEPNNRKI